MRNLRLLCHLHNSSQVIEAEKGQAAERREDKSTSLKRAALNLFALEVDFFFLPLGKNRTSKTEAFVRRSERVRAGFPRSA